MPRKKTAYVESLRDASAQTGIALPLLQAARAAGCPAFKGSRVRLDLLRTWIDDNPEILTDERAEGTETLLALKQELIRQQIRRTLEQVRAAQIANGEAEGRLIPVAEAVATVHALISELRGHFRRIEDALPQALAGLSLPDQRIVVRKFFDDMGETIHNSRLSAIKEPASA